MASEASCASGMTPAGLSSAARAAALAASCGASATDASAAAVAASAAAEAAAVAAESPAARSARGARQSARRASAQRKVCSVRPLASRSSPMLACGPGGCDSHRPAVPDAASTPLRAASPRTQRA